jgi:putative transposase
MPQSLARVVVHLVFSTKHRQPFLDADVRPKVFAYMATIVRNLECECYRVGGVEDHVHLAIRLSRKTSIADLVRVLKASSSKWIKTQADYLESFSWQGGYAVFSVDHERLDRLLAYIDRQEEHHRKAPFQQEYIHLLVRNGIEYDPRFVWD